MKRRVNYKKMSRFCVQIHFTPCSSYLITKNNRFQFEVLHFTRPFPPLNLTLWLTKPVETGPVFVNTGTVPFACRGRQFSIKKKSNLSIVTKWFSLLFFQLIKAVLGVKSLFCRFCKHCFTLTCQMSMQHCNMVLFCMIRLFFLVQ